MRTVMIDNTYSNALILDGETYLEQINHNLLMTYLENEEIFLSHFSLTFEQLHYILFSDQMICLQIRTIFYRSLIANNIYSKYFTKILKNSKILNCRS